MGDKLGKVGLIGRFKPLHNGAAVLLESICEKAQHVVIGIGSSNKYNARNPFTAKETEEMINIFLSDKFKNYEILKVPDFAHIPGNEDGKMWKEYVLKAFGKLDYFISGNDFVRELLKDDYEIIHPGNIVPKERHVLLRATKVRYEMATYQNWQTHVPENVTKYLGEKKLVERFRTEFGLLTIASVIQGNDYNENEDIMHEKLHAQEK